MNPFTTHGIDHLSASAINQFAASPAIFVLERVLKRKTPVGAAAHRGSAVEDGIVHGLTTGADDDACVTYAMASFDRRAALSGDLRRDTERKAVGDMVKTGLAELRSYGEPTSIQGKIEHSFPDVMVPLIGFYDTEWAQHGILIDIKSTHRIPSEISTSHARQVALYQTARSDNADARLSYISPKRAATYQLENFRRHLAAMERIALTIQRFLSISADPQELVAIVAPDTDSYYLADPSARQAAFDVWGY
jgi:hypothetical protein